MKSFILSLCLVSTLLLHTNTAHPLDDSLLELNDNIGREIEDVALDTPTFQADEVQSVRQI